MSYEVCQDKRRRDKLLTSGTASSSSDSDDEDELASLDSTTKSKKGMSDLRTREKLCES